MPLGAAMVFKGIEGAMPFLHGSQGCSTYIRRYMISHFREPVDIASSNFSEETAVFGGRSNLENGLKNVISQYHPAMIGVATTCLSETIGDDIAGHLRAFRLANPDAPPLVHVSTPSYAATHAEGYTAAVKAVVEQLVPFSDRSSTDGQLNIFPNMLSPEDLRYLKCVIGDFSLHCVVLPDYSDTLDGPSWKDYELIPSGGTKIDEIRLMGRARASISMGRITTRRSERDPGVHLFEKNAVPLFDLGVPIGLRETDRLFAVLETLSGKDMPQEHLKERGRLVDAFVDGHKYVAGKKVVIYGEEDMVVGMASFLSEAGFIPVLCASGGQSGYLKSEVQKVLARPMEVDVIDGADFADIEEKAQSLKPDVIIGSSKGYKLSRKLGVPLVRAGFPVHDRIGGQRIVHVGYRGALALYDRVVNALLDAKQERSEIGYSYM